MATEVPTTNNTGDALAEGNSMTFGDVNETVTAKDVSNLRSTPYTGDEGNVVGQLKNGETLVRTGRNDSTRMVQTGIQRPARFMQYQHI